MVPITPTMGRCLGSFVMMFGAMLQAMSVVALPTM